MNLTLILEGQKEKLVLVQNRKQLGAEQMWCQSIVYKRSLRTAPRDHYQGTRERENRQRAPLQEWHLSLQELPEQDGLTYPGSGPLDILAPVKKLGHKQDGGGVGDLNFLWSQEFS